MALVVHRWRGRQVDAPLELWAATTVQVAERLRQARKSERMLRQRASSQESSRDSRGARGSRCAHRRASTAGLQAGWLLKEGCFHNEVRRPRWCELSSDGLLRYSLSRGGALKGAVDVRGATVALSGCRLEIAPRTIAGARRASLKQQLGSLCRGDGPRGAYAFEAADEALAATWQRALLATAVGVQHGTS